MRALMLAERADLPKDIIELGKNDGEGEPGDERREQLFPSGAPQREAIDDRFFWRGEAEPERQNPAKGDELNRGENKRIAREPYRDRLRIAPMQLHGECKEEREREFR